jgi:maltooligosyltrehalose trehalohydrolase
LSDRVAEKEFRAYPKSWGAEFVREGEVRFRLWAPGAEQVSVRLDDNDAEMGALKDGWFEMLASGVSPGARYSFVLPDGRAVPDPASRAQAGDVHGPSEIVDPTAYRWRHAGWRGRPWEDAVIYELHVGAFTPQGTFRAAAERLEYLAELGITAIELMPVAQFSGTRGWGYDGVLLYAPHAAYGTPEEMKALVDAAHGHGLMVLLDVVYNHFGPDGNYLHAYAPDFFHPERKTPWGAAIAYEKEPARRFFVENALYWIEEFNLDGLRLDAIDQIGDEVSRTHILEEVARSVQAEHPHRHVHLTTEDNRNVTHLLERDPEGRPRLYTAEWNDDFHNAVHVVATGETEGYYADFSDDAAAKLARSIAEGFAYQGERSAHAGRNRGEPSAHLPPAAFIDFLQNHDQIGNRALGERLISLADSEKVRALTAMLLLSPHIPLIFMGEEYGETLPFNFFTDFQGELADAVREGRRKEFADFSAFLGGDLTSIPDPNAEATFDASKLDWSKLETVQGRDRIAFIQGLISLRRHHIQPLLEDMKGHAGRVLAVETGMLAVDWMAGKKLLQMRANLGDEPSQAPAISGEVIHAEPADARTVFVESGALPSSSVVVAIGSGEG